MMPPDPKHMSTVELAATYCRTLEELKAWRSFGWAAERRLKAACLLDGPIVTSEGTVDLDTTTYEYGNGEAVAARMPALIKGARAEFTGPATDVQRLVSIAEEQFPSGTLEMKHAFLIDKVKAGKYLRSFGQAGQTLRECASEVKKITIR